MYIAYKHRKGQKKFTPNVNNGNSLKDGIMSDVI